MENGRRGDRKMLELYKYRIKALRTETGTAKWHSIMAKIRAYHGDPFGSLMHSVSAFLKRIAKAIEPMMKKFAEMRSEVQWDV